MSVISGLIDRKIVKIITILINKPEEHFHIQKLSAASKVPLSSTFRIVNKLAQLNIVKITTIGKFKIYKIKKDQISELKTIIGGKKWTGKGK